MRNLILSGGIRHDFDDNTAAVIELLDDIGISTEYTDDINSGIERLASEPFDLVTVMALRWSMGGGQKYATLRDEYGYSMSLECRKTLVDYIRRGGGLFGLHTACLCFDDWAQWRDVLGGAWVWGQSFHPPLGPVSVSHTATRFTLASISLLTRYRYFQHAPMTALKRRYSGPILSKKGAWFSMRSGTIVARCNTMSTAALYNVVRPGQAGLPTKKCRLCSLFFFRSSSSLS